MLRKAKELRGYNLGAIDGEIGRVKEFYIEDISWTVRYLVADTNKWLAGKQVLISPFAIRGVDDAEKKVNVNLTREKIEQSPSIAEDKPVSRQYESQFYQYYGWPAYWYGPALWGPAPFPVFGHAGTPSDPHPFRLDEGGDPHLRSTAEVTGYHLHAGDGEIGHVEDFVIDDENWAIRYLVIDTRNWWPGRNVLIPVAAVRNVSWDKSSVSVDLLRETIKTAPEYDERTALHREYEAALFRHLDHDPYWSR